MEVAFASAASSGLRSDASRAAPREPLFGCFVAVVSGIGG